MLTGFNAAAKLLNYQAGLKLNEKYDLFFVDYSMIPLLIQDCYLRSYPAHSRSTQDLDAVWRAADSISKSEVLS